MAPPDREPAARVPLYARVKEAIVERIASGQIGPGGRLPSEHELMAEFGVSRMTAHRALRELSAAGLVARVQGRGSFAAPPSPRLEWLEIRDISDEIVASGHRHRVRVLAQEATRARADQALAFGLRPGARIFHATLLHYEDDVPVQIEDRLVSPRFAPDFLEQDFTKETVAAYLLRLGPATETEHVVYATTPSPEIRALLEIGRDEEQACLVVLRRTWSGGLPATQTEFIHPGARYALGTRSSMGDRPDGPAAP